MTKVFSEEWFEQWQKTLLFFLRLYDRKIVKITPNSLHRKIEDNNYVAIIYSNNFYAIKLYRWFFPIWWGLHFLDCLSLRISIYNKVLNFGFDTLTVNPVAGTNSPCDGYAQRYNVNETFAVITAGVANIVGPSADSCVVYIKSSLTSNQFNNFIRGIINFNTSSLTGRSIISNAVFSGATHTSAKYCTFDTEPDLHIAKAYPASTATIVNNDLPLCDHTSFGSISYASFSAVAGTYNDITMNSDGINAINRGGVTSISLQLSWDINGVFGATWWGNKATWFFIRSADSAGGTPPKMVITYSIPSRISII